eukprot:124505_1
MWSGWNILILWWSSLMESILTTSKWKASPITSMRSTTTETSATSVSSVSSTSTMASSPSSFMFPSSMMPSASFSTAFTVIATLPNVLGMTFHHIHNDWDPLFHHLRIDCPSIHLNHWNRKLFD